jgi:hypothetical protein
MRAYSAWRFGLAILWFPVLGSGCLTKVAANTTANFLTEAAPAARAYFDYESAGNAAANGLIQLEGLHRISPGNENLTLTLAQGYVAYAFGWVMDRQEAAQLDGRFDEADREQARAYFMYERARLLVLSLMRQRDDGIDRALERDPAVLTAYLREHYADPEDDIELVFWLAVAWGSVISNSPSNTALIDLPQVKALAQHSVALDEKYENGGALALLGGFEAAYPEQLGGNWKKGREYFERAIAISGRRNHLHQINFARIYAVNAQDRALFVSLMREVIESGDQGDAVRLSNKVARRRAERYLRYVDELFLE